MNTGFLLVLTCAFLVVLLNMNFNWKDCFFLKTEYLNPNTTEENTPLQDICVFVDIERMVKLCPDTPSIVSSECNGRFGNQISSLATLLAFNNKFGLRPVIYQYQMDKLVEYFEDINVPVFLPDERIEITAKMPSFLNVSLALIRESVVSHKVEKAYYYDNILKNPDPFMRGRALDIGKYPNGLFLYKDILKEIKNEFKIKREYLENAKEVLKNIGKRYVGKTVIYVGVHVRRTDWESYLRSYGNRRVTYVNESYFKQGMDKFRWMFAKDGDVVFVVVSDDVPWILQHFENEPGVFIGSFRAKAKASSQENSRNVAFNVVDGVVDKKQFVSKTEAFPWLEIDLESQVLIDRVAIFPRGDCCQERFGNFQVRLGNKSLAQHLYKEARLSTHGYLCGKVEKNFIKEQPINVKCQTPQSSRYILVQGTKSSMTLELGEVMWLGPGERLSPPSQQVGSPAVRDFALLSICNHSLLTYGTFGQWAALYAGGYVIMPIGYMGGKVTKPMKEIQQANLTNWEFLRVD